MNLTVEQLLEQVKHFLSTGQPNMAILYMRKALELLQNERMTAAVATIWDALEEAFTPMVKALTEVIERVAAVVRGCYQTTKADFALVAEA